MRGRGITLMIVAVLLFYFLLCLWWAWMEHRNQAFSHPEMTLQERQMVKKALKRHGEFPITREGYGGRYFMHIKGKRVAL